MPKEEKEEESETFPTTITSIDTGIAGIAVNSDTSGDRGIASNSGDGTAELKCGILYKIENIYKGNDNIHYNYMSTIQQDIRKKHWEEVARLQQEVEWVEGLVNEIHGLTLIKKGNEEFSLIDDALYCAGKYWYDHDAHDYTDSLKEIEICAIIIKKT